MNAKEIIRVLDLKPLPEEGGFYKETYRSDELIPKGVLPGRYIGDKCFSTAIYYLLTPEICSAIHRVPSEEIFHFYTGDPVTMLQLYPDGESKVTTIGSDLAAGNEPQVIVPRGVWQGCFLNEGGGFALMGTTVAPGFDFSDYENGIRRQLLETHPDRSEMIIRLTPGQ